MENNDEQKHFVIKNEMKTKDERVQKIKNIGLKALDVAVAMFVFSVGYMTLEASKQLLQDELIVSAISCGISGACLLGKGIKIADYFLDSIVQKDNVNEEINEGNIINLDDEDNHNGIGGKQR